MRISVILPVYNGAAYVAETIRSILAQTERDFELLVINDGSTDHSEGIILSFQDSRIRYISQSNQGLIAVLNRGIIEAKGKYTARIDADDICLPERFAKQSAWLDERPGTSLAGCFTTFIDARGNETGSWPADRENYTAAQIRHALPFVNCITHPGIMARTEVLRQYGYDTGQRNVEDYDLWLRLQADGHVMEKVPEVLLLYRVHEGSITAGSLQQKFRANYHCKQRYLAGRLRKGKINGFDLRVVVGMARDLLIWAKKSMMK